MHFGIDYGSKLAGTSVVTWDEGDALRQVSSAKKKDADKMILDLADRLRPKVIYLDAPLSLPKAYFGHGEDYFYRACDRSLKAMSPMFLAGLTARAMKLKHQLDKLGIQTIETYPGALIRSIPQLDEVYSKKDRAVVSQLFDRVKTILEGYHIQKSPTTLHQIDSLVAWYSGYRHKEGMAVIIGEEDEGLIVY